MPILRHITFHLAWLACRLFAGATTGIGAEYYIGYLNKTGHDLDEVSVYSDNKLWGLPARLWIAPTG